MPVIWDNVMYNVIVSYNSHWVYRILSHDYCNCWTSCQCSTWWRHRMGAFSALLAFVRGIHRSPVQSPHKSQWRGASFDVFNLCLNKQMSKQSIRRWIETPSRSLWRHSNIYLQFDIIKCDFIFAVFVMSTFAVIREDKLWIDGDIAQTGTNQVGISVFWKINNVIQRDSTLQWRHNGRDSVSNHQPHDCLHNRLSRCRSKKTSKFCVTGPCVWTGEFPAQMASNAEKVSIWWRHHETRNLLTH